MARSGGKGGSGTTAMIKGNSRGNVLVGTAGDDTIDGGAGADTMIGSTGDDVYFVDRVDDVVVEKAGEGVDTVYAASDYTLAAGVENLVLTGTRAIAGTGNELANAISGNASANNLSGGAGDDLLAGGGGDDRIDGGAGADTASFALSFADYALTMTAAGLEVEALAGTDGADLLTGIEYLRFADGLVAVPSNRAPTAANDANSTTTHAAIAGNVLANDSDPDGQALKVAAVNGEAANVGQVLTLASGARLTLGADGGYTYDPTAAFGGLGDGQTASDSFTYTITDGAGGIATATVLLSVAGDPEPSPQPVPYYVQDLLLGDAQRWNYPNAPGTGAALTFAFLEDVPDYYNESHWANSGFRSFTEQQRAMTRDALADIEGYSNLRFVETDASQAAITFGIANIPTGVGYAYGPGGTGIGLAAGDVWLYSGYAGDSFALGSGQYKTLIHEIGHAIGLDHPGATLTGDENSRMYTAMSYSHHPSALAEPETHMLFDVAAVQYLYGANATSRTGDDVYGLADLADKVRTIWDAGGEDTIDVAGATGSVLLDLRAGEHSTVAGWGAYNFAIAYGTTIENAIGGGGADTLIGNAAANRLDGGHGGDVLTGGAGSDVFAFGTDSGADQITDFTRGEDVIDLSAFGVGLAGVSITTSGASTVVSIGSSQITLIGVGQLDASDLLV